MEDMSDSDDEIDDDDDDHHDEDEDEDEDDDSNEVEEVTELKSPYKSLKPVKSRIKKLENLSLLNKSQRNMVLLLFKYALKPPELDDLDHYDWKQKHIIPAPADPTHNLLNSIWKRYKLEPEKVVRIPGSEFERSQDYWIILLNDHESHERCNLRDLTRRFELNKSQSFFQTSVLSRGRNIEIELTKYVFQPHRWIHESKIFKKKDNIEYWNLTFSCSDFGIMYPPITIMSNEGTTD
eukprot:TRINITY_DN5090_c0_g1_i3.p1 TRINITY_DN5090_c0_g1~~TRINITY_DN5090_c0_g1_i3.p1  ORF type:complete len:237 (-),score=76.93 TRINITY_DN5090_c0_g1_i3:81-791(-)